LAFVFSTLAIGEVIITNRSEPELAHSATTHLDAGQEAHFMISFCAHAEGVYKSAVRIAVIDNEFENVRCILNAEAYKDSVSLENLPPLPFHLQGTVMKIHINAQNSHGNVQHFYNTTFLQSYKSLQNFKSLFW